MKTIIAATDFSDAALNAAEYAADMAQAINAHLLLVYVYQLPVIYLEIPIATEADQTWTGSEETLSQLKERLIKRSSGNLRVESRFVTGVFFPELKKICEEIKPYAVVMGSQGTTAAQRVFFGGHTIYAMEHLQWPLITVPPHAAFSKISKIFLACDFNKVLESTPVEEIKRLVNDFHAELHVINSGKEDSYKPDLVFESGMLQEILAPLKPQYHLITGENTDESIINFLENNHIDLLITLPKRRGLLEKLAHRSISKQLILHSHIPVMAMHPASN
jgi:nucleotide-binding universal stress UspA family protein